MGSYDGAEVCELVRLYLLGKLAPLIGRKSVGIYRDDGLNFFSYMKLSNSRLYIHSESNNPPSIIKQLSSMINKCISNLSCNEHEFNKYKPLYESALKSSGFNYSMKFEAPVENARRNRKSYGSIRHTV